jgi:hypothetical protein
MFKLVRMLYIALMIFFWGINGRRNFRKVF